MVHHSAEEQLRRVHEFLHGYRTCKKRTLPYVYTKHVMYGYG